ncbi:hypothetical protein BGX21_008981 [Mortierella sp. AD011]|nr:hypothetical protein BGX20_001495 [Mortierella sp. AD010]KAF9402720.1 hypothetical protein BGX21_008981 [Mortierella sp. AD011]
MTVLHLEQYRLSQEAAKCFDDDLDFCPSLTAKELSEIILASILAQKESQAKQQQQQRSSGVPSPTSPTSVASSVNPSSRAITIMDPNSRTPLYIPTATVNKTYNGSAAGRSGRFSGSTTPATAGLMAQPDSYFNFMPTMNRQQQQQQQQQMFNTMYGSHGYQYLAQSQQQHQQAYTMGMTSPTMTSYSPPRLANRIPIVNPNNGNVVAVPETPSASPAWHQEHFVAVR